jgi:nucleoside-diphosphate-sugar epimerase
MQEAEIKTVLVTGANGFIGSRLCRLLAASGYDIRILCRETSDLSLLKDIPYSKFIGDVTQPESLSAAVSGVDYIIHSAGLIKAKNAKAFFRVNQHGTLALLNAVKNNNLGLKKFVLVSSVAAAGPAAGTPRKEEDPPQPLTTYGRSKLAGEEALTAFYDLFPITIIRPPAVYGPGDKAILTLFDTVNKGFKPYMAGGRNLVQMVYVDDLILAIKIAMESDRSSGEAYFIAETEAHTVREMMDIMGTQLGKKGLGIYIPLWLLNIIAFVSETFFKLIGRAPLFSREKVRELTADWALDVSKARDQLEFETAVDFRTGAQNTIEWYRREGWLK